MNCQMCGEEIKTGTVDNNTGAVICDSFECKRDYMEESMSRQDWLDYMESYYSDPKFSSETEAVEIFDEVDKEKFFHRRVS